MARKSKTGATLPPHRARGPRWVPADEPFDEMGAAYGLTVLLYGPAAGVCAACDEPADRLTADGRLCPDCAEPWGDTPRKAS